jgi:hypothetical protein
MTGDFSLKNASKDKYKNLIKEGKIERSQSISKRIVTKNFSSPNSLKINKGLDKILYLSNRFDELSKEEQEEINKKFENFYRNLFILSRDKILLLGLYKTYAEFKAAEWFDYLSTYFRDPFCLLWKKTRTYHKIGRFQLLWLTNVEYTRLLKKSDSPKKNIYYKGNAYSVNEFINMNHSLKKDSKTIKILHPKQKTYKYRNVKLGLKDYINIYRIEHPDIPIGAKNLDIRTILSRMENDNMDLDEALSTPKRWGTQGRRGKLFKQFYKKIKTNIKNKKNALLNNSSGIPIRDSNESETGDN